VDIRILGPIEVWHDGKQIPLLRAQQRLILGILALETGTLVPTDRLVDLLWGSRPIQNARNVIHSRVSNLRRRIGAAINGDADFSLDTHGGGYILQVPEEWVDAHRFRRMVSEATGTADQASKLDQLREALRLWRGPAFGGDLSDGALSVTSDRLESARLTVIEEIFDIELRRGYHAQIIEEIVDAATANPSRERLAHQMMTALYRASRPAEALRAYHQYRKRLADEMGIDPGSEIQKLYVTMLQSGESGTTSDVASLASSNSSHENLDNSDTDFAVTTPNMLPPDIPDFTNRTSETDALVEILTQGQGSSVAVVTTSGQGGIGKTALAIHVAHRLLDRFPDGQLYINLHGEGDQPLDPSVVLARFLRALGVDEMAVPASLDERVELYRDLLAQRRILVVLDNAADDAQVQPLIPGSPTNAVIVAGRARLGTTLSGDRLDLSLLDPTHAVGLLARTAGAERIEAEPEAAAELAELCGYLPLALRIVGARLAAKPHWSVARMVRMLQSQRRRLDELAYRHLDVRASIDLSYRGLDPAAQRLLRRLGDLGAPEITTWTSAALLDITPAAAEELLENLFDAQLLSFLSNSLDGSPRYRMHDLVRLFASERAHLEETVSELRAGRRRCYAAHLFLAVSARSAFEGGDYATIHSGADQWAVDDQQLIAAIADDPMGWFEQERPIILMLIERASGDHESEVCWDMACTLSVLFQGARQFADWRRALDDALKATEQANNRLGQAATLHALGCLATNHTDYENARKHFHQARELFLQLGNRYGAALSLALIGHVERFEGSDQAALDAYSEALPALQEFRDHSVEAAVVRGIGQIHLQRGAYELADDYLARALQISHAHCASESQNQGLFWQSMLRLRQERYTVAETGFRDTLRATQALGERAGEAQSLRGLGLCLAKQGHIGEGRATVQRALALVRQPRRTFLETHIRQTLIEIEGMQVNP
jgi:DNA-binding SARP family transcriptional activator/tetratricopeptide (TPR) repeat protein